MIEELIGIEITGGINTQGEGFVTIKATSRNGGVFIGQLPPNLTRDLGLDCFVAAKKAEELEKRVTL